MENESMFAQAEDGRSSKRGRLMGKLFGGKDRKPDYSSASNANVEAFLQSSSDNLQVTHPPPPLPPTSVPKLAKLDTSISRYPQALAVNQQAQQNRPMGPGTVENKSPRKSPRPNKKGTTVRFTDSYPEVIGEGGDESEIPVMEIAKRKPARPPPPPAHRKAMQPPGRGPPDLAGRGPPVSNDDFQPKPLRRTQTGYSSISSFDDNARPSTKPVPSPNNLARSQTVHNTLVPGQGATSRYLESPGRHDENRKSFIEVQEAQMRQAEGKALVAARTASIASEHRWEDGEAPPDNISDSTESLRRVQSSSSEVQSRRGPIDYSPAASIASSTSLYPPSNPPAGLSQTTFASRMNSNASRNGHSPDVVLDASSKLHDMVISPDDDALATFVIRTKHLFELFRLHAETIKPLSACTLDECARGGLWWFLKGRMGLETAIRERPDSPKGQMQNEMDRQQAYSNLAKGYWLCQEAIPEICQSHHVAPEPEITNASQTLTAALRKLAGSMKRNGFLPPEEAFLPQSIDKSIWIEYPPLSQDMLALLSGNWNSGMTVMQQPVSTLELLEALPIGDTPENFSYGRVAADVFLMEQGRENQRFFFPCFLSMIRPQKYTGLIFSLASQDGSVQLAIQDKNKTGASWDDVRWHNETCTLDVRLPRGFMLAVQLSQTDYRMLWSMFDFGTKVRSTLTPRSDEVVAFRSTLRAFQYIDSDPQSRAFPKEPVSLCEVALLEKVYKENGPSGQRVWHTGFRIAVVSGPRTRTLSGVHHNFPPQLPVQFGFFRAEGEAPALSVKFDNGRQRGRMVLIFSDERERIQFNALLTGTALDHGEKIYANVPIKGFAISQSLREPTGMAPFSRMPWKTARVVNEEYGSGGEEPSTVLADRLKIVMEYQDGTVTDRVNVAPGELRVRLEVTNAKLLRLLRQPQQDITMAVSESQVPKEFPRLLSDALQLVKSNQTIRTFEFESLKHLHDFQAAVTGFEVLFDGLAATFAIARRRMVVPIHKKWEAGFTRIQLVRQEDKQLQLLAFFEEFSHGHCMNFVLKGTDLYETFQRSGKFGIKFVDAKFPLPRLPADKDGDFDDMAFVCLDLPDLPGEHDDISILFEKEADRDRLCGLLPAPAKGSVRITSRLVK